jgi:hypothetical protein
LLEPLSGRPSLFRVQPAVAVPVELLDELDLLPKHASRTAASEGPSTRTGRGKAAALAARSSGLRAVLGARRSAFLRRKECRRRGDQRQCGNTGAEEGSPRVFSNGSHRSPLSPAEFYPAFPLFLKLSPGTESGRDSRIPRDN